MERQLLAAYQTQGRNAKKAEKEVAIVPAFAEGGAMSTDNLSAGDIKKRL
jgi:hypothetical protein